MTVASLQLSDRCQCIGDRARYLPCAHRHQASALFAALVLCMCWFDAMYVLIKQEAYCAVEAADRACMQQSCLQKIAFVCTAAHLVQHNSCVHVKSDASRSDAISS